MGGAGQGEAGWKGQLWAWVATAGSVTLGVCTCLGHTSYLQCSDALTPRLEPRE